MNKIKNKSIWVLSVNIILSLALFIINIFYQLNAPAWNLTFKFIGSGIFVLLGIINFIFAIKTPNLNFNFALTTLIGLVLSFAGDVAIEYEFIAGAALFALAHICYIVGFYFIKKFHWLDILITAIFAIPATLLIGLLPVFNFNPPVLQYVVIIYAVIISFMFGKALSNLIRERNFHTIIVFIGAILFVLSDFALLIELFHVDGSYHWGHACMAIYFPALLIFAYSIYYQSKNSLNIKNS